MKVWIPLFLSILQFFIICNQKLFSATGEISELKGAISVNLEPGSPEKPFFLVTSSSLKGEAVFRGQVKQTADNNISFYEVPNLLDPDEMQPPFKNGMLSTKRARGSVELEANGTIARVNIDFPGSNYFSTPEVYIDLPTSGTSTASDFRKASIEATVDMNIGEITALTIKDSGLGYDTIPKISIEGGTHFIRLAEKNSAYTGNFFKIQANDGSTILVDNPLNLNLSQIFLPNQLVEIYEAWTLGSLFGHTSEEVMLSEGNQTSADRIYLLKPFADQNGSMGDFCFFYHDGNIWRSNEDVDKNDSADSIIIDPDQAFILARRNSSPLELVFSGSATTNDTFGNLPGYLERKLLSNPYGVDIMLSDLISASSITSDENETEKWLANSSQEIADNVKILTDNVWSTYWNDGKNRSVTKVASATARYGTGIGGSLTQQDISMSSGTISNMTNPSPTTGNLIVTSSNHGLKNGFMVFIEGVEGYKTNELKQQVDEDGALVSQGAIPFVIQSGANGFFEIQVLDSNNFELIGKSGNCDFIDNGTASWSTGSGGLGYTSNAFVSFVGGGGSGAMGIANVDPSTQKVVSILITDAGAGYVSAPKVFIHSGGWKKLGSGNAPFNDALIPAGAGILLVRNNPKGIRTHFSINSPFSQ